MNKLSFDSRYNVAPDILWSLRELQKMIPILKAVNERENTIDTILMDVTPDSDFPAAILTVIDDMIFSIKEINTHKYMYALVAAYFDKRTTDNEKQILKELLIMCKGPLYYTRLEVMNVQMGWLNGTADDRGSADHSTRLQLIIALHNDDRYIVRFDMPHKDHPYFHVNIEETIEKDGEVNIVPTAFPMDMSDGEYSWIADLAEEYFEKIFFRQEKMCWFRTNFLEKVVEIESSEMRGKLEDLYNKRIHFEVVKDMDVSEEDLIALFDKLRDILSLISFENCRMISFAKDKENMISLMNTTRLKGTRMKFLLSEIKNGLDNQFQFINIKELVYLVLDDNQKSCISQSEFKEASLCQIVKELIKI